MEFHYAMMSHTPNIEILKTPRVLRGFDAKGDDIVFSRVNEDKELWIISHGEAQKLCRGFSPLFVGDSILYIDAEQGDRTDIFLYQEGTCLNLTKEGRNLAPLPSPRKSARPALPFPFTRRISPFSNE